MEKERSLVIGEKIEVRTMMVGTRGSGVTNGTRALENAALPAISSRRYLLTFFFLFPMSKRMENGKRTIHRRRGLSHSRWIIAIIVDDR